MVSAFGVEDTFEELAFDSTLDALLLSESITSPSFEGDFMSNFACCGMILADLHALLEHFETAHRPQRVLLGLEIPAPPTPPPSSCSLSDLLAPAATQALSSSDSQDALPPLPIPITPSRSRTIDRPTRRERVEAHMDKDRNSRRRKRRREYACTKTPGCIKEYLNKNGLKYHLEKGECVVPKE
ncbi:hypothetical protein BDZ89DRAFT_1071669 [Hymenopellis radicata]|nr:hypothetical protein BDZ89DRAFT_1071669 [Hymenopellis radicata]